MIPQLRRLSPGASVARRHRHPGSAHVRLVALLAAGIALLGTPACGRDHSDAFTTPFAPTSPWREPITGNPPIDPKSAEMIAYIQPRPRLTANLVEFGIPIYRVSSETPTHTVSCTKDWGVCPFAGWPVPIPDGASPHSGSDGAMVTVDESRATTFEFWQAAVEGGKWSTSWGAVNSLAGSGWGGVSTGSGASRLGGVIRIAEIAAGDIRHALALQTSNACPEFRAPALKSDGVSDRQDCLPEGARLQLDPSLDVTKLGLTRGELAVATAMQRYGGYIVDQGGAPLSMSFELDKQAGRDSVGKTYREAGFRWDYDAMEHIPWDKLRVLA